MPYIQQLYTQCLSEAAYYLESNGVAAIIDPLRDVDTYMKLAAERKATIAYIFETHFHADFVSGHLDLARKTGAKIIYGPQAKTSFEKYEATDQEIFPLGNCTIQVMHTPGHTLESTCFLLFDEEQKPTCLFTGDTLFVGDVGRPDLFSGNMTKEDLASLLFDSLQRIKTLPGEVVVYPAHGPGSSCGKNLGPNTSSTIQEQKETNYALKIDDKMAFIEAVTEGLSAPPAYFPINAKINQQGYHHLEEIMQHGLKPLSVQEFIEAHTADTIILDTRKATTFTQGFIPGSMSIGLEGRFAEWAGSLISFNVPILLVTEKGAEEESVIRLSRVGFDKMIGYLEGGIEAWVAAGEQLDLIIDIEPDELAMDLNYDQKMMVIDVRKELEFDNGHVQTAVNIPLQSMTDIATIARLDDSDNMYIHCAGGYRSVIAASILKKHGLHNLRNVVGGYEQIKLIPKMPLVAAKELLN
jgi:hydroxyacylglutathione hydrolase